MKLTTPARYRTICDRCREECTPSNYTQRTSIQIERALLDYQGSPVANGNAQFDLCNACTEVVLNGINKLLVAEKPQ